MKVDLQPGCYVVAVSGGVDSMVLLDVLRQLPQLKLVVAHYDHGIRKDSVKDRLLVQQAAKNYGLQFVYDQGNLGAKASEARARKARYDFLHKVRVSCHADAIITAHHQDDMLETAILNIIRGTGRRGLSSLSSKDRLLRPLLGYSKQQLQAYAKAHDVLWREDQTNADEKYLRNYIRHKILNKLSISEQQQLLNHIEQAKTLNQEIDSLLDVQLHVQAHVNKLDRQWFIQLPHNVAREVMASWLRTQGIAYNRPTVERLVVAGKTYPAGKQADIAKGFSLNITKRFLELETAQAKA